MGSTINTKYFVSFLLLLFCFVGLSAQNARTISGQVLAENGTPLNGAKILEVGTQNGAFSDQNGNFTLTVSSNDASLEVSFIGFSTQTIPTAGKSSLSISMQESGLALDEVVVVGYGTQQRDDLTGSISAINKENLEGRPVANFQDALQGQVAGLQITNSTGAPGGGTNVVIRGIGTINGGSAPLYVIDGNIIGTSIGNQGAAFTRPDPLSTINPSDIESITVLKDASAAAMYGARAANGVIIITTKRGEAGAPQFSFNAFAGVQNATNTLDLLNSQQYQQVMNTARDNGGLDRITSLDGTTLTTDTDWQDEIFRTAAIQSYELSASGGTPRTKYYTSLNYTDQDGIIIGTGLERVSVRVNTDTKLGRFKVGNSLNISRTTFDKESIGNSQSILSNAIANQPNVPVRDPNSIGGFAGPTPADGEPTLNPVAAQSLVTNENVTNRILATVFGEVEIVNGLNYRLNLSADLISFHDRFAAPLFEQGGLQIPGFEDGAQVREARGESNSYLIENTLNFKRIVNKHNIDLLGGFTAQQTEFENLNARVVGQFTGSGLPIISGSNDIRSFGGIVRETRTTSIIGRAMYDYDGRYLATVNFRRDGSSRFVGDNVFGNFWSASAGWNIGKEAFMENSGIDLKVRGSYGELGNDAINANAARFTLNNNATYVLGDGQVLAPGVGPAGAVQNSDLRWERQKQLNIGLDIAFMDRALEFTIDYFDKVSEDLLLTVPVPNTTGFNSITLNAGEIQNTGFEFTGRYNVTLGEDFNLSLSANATILDNEVTSLFGDIEGIERDRFSQLGNATRTRIEEGQSVGAFYGYVVEGIFQSQEEINNAPDQGFDNTAPGDFRYKDISGENGQPDGVIDQFDRTFIGNPIPDLLYGFSVAFDYKNFDFSAQFQGVAGNDIWSETKFFSQSYARTNNLTTAVLDAWTPSNPSTTTPRALPQTVSNNDLISSFFIEPGDYLRLANLQLGYKIPVNNVSFMRFARVYFAAQNLLTFSDYQDVGYDPEVGTNGIDNVVYPRARVITGGVQIQF